MQCRICFEEGGRLVSPCSCRGTAAYIHPHCLESYFYHYPDRVCRVCNETMKMYATGVQIIKLCSIFIFLGFLISISSSNIYTKILFGISIASLFVYYICRELFDPRHLGVIFILSILFLSGGHELAIMSIIGVIFVAGFLCTLRTYVPFQYLALIGMNLIVSLYALALTFAIFPQTDRSGFTVYMCIMYLLWYPWARGMRLRVQ